MSEIQLTGLSQLAKSNSYVLAFQNLASEIQESHKSPRTSVAQRAEEWRQTLAKMDDEKLLIMQEKMSDFVDAVSKHSIDFGEYPKELDGQQRVQLMQSTLSAREIKEFLDVYLDYVRSAVFSVVTEKNASEGKEDPEHEKGEIRVLSLGKRFCKEGGGRKDPVLNTDLLQEFLSKEEWESCYEIEHVPAHTEVKFSIEKMMKLAESDPSILEKIRKSLTPGDWKSNSFTVRDITQ